MAIITQLYHATINLKIIFSSHIIIPCMITFMRRDRIAEANVIVLMVLAANGNVEKKKTQHLDGLWDFMSLTIA